MLATSHWLHPFFPHKVGSYQGFLHVPQLLRLRNAHETGRILKSTRPQQLGQTPRLEKNIERLMTRLCPFRENRCGAGLVNDSWVPRFLDLDVEWREPSGNQPARGKKGHRDSSWSSWSVYIHLWIMRAATGVVKRTSPGWQEPWNRASEETQGVRSPKSTSQHRHYVCRVH